MIEIKLKSQLAKIFSVKEQDSDFLLKLLIEKIEKKIKDSETIKIDSVGYFKKEGDELIFSPFQFEEGEPLFLTLKTEKPNADIYSFDEDIFSVGGDANITPALSIASGELNLEEIESLMDGIIKTSEIIENYDLIGNAIEISENQQNNEEIPTEIDTSWQEELKNELLSDDLFDDIKEESEEQPEKNEPIEELDLDNDFDFDNMKKELAGEVNSDDNLPFDNSENFGKEEGFEQIKSDTVEQGKLDSLFDDIEETSPTKQETEKSKEKEKENKLEKKGTDKKEETKGESTEGKPKKKKGKLLIIILVVVILLGGGGGAFYFFFWDSFFGEQKTEKLDENNAKDSTKTPITPFTKKELGEAGSDSVKTHDIHSDSLNLNKKIDEEYVQVDPRLIREFKDDKKITHSIYFAEGKYMVQISSWKSSETASNIVEKLYQRGFDAFVVKAYLPQLGGYWYRVRIGFFKTQKEAESFLAEQSYKYVK